MPARLTAVDENIAALLRANLPYREIADITGLSASTIIRRRETLGLPPRPRGRRAAPSLRTAFESRTRPGPDGHLFWTGGVSNGVASFHQGSTQYTANRVAFWLRTGVWPTGHARPECGMAGCVAPAHVDDMATRVRDRAALAAITGQRRRLGDACRRGHAYAVHGRFKPSGRRYCARCQRDRQQGVFPP